MGHYWRVERQFVWPLARQCKGIGPSLSFEATPGGPAAKLKSAPASFRVRHVPADGSAPQELPYAPPQFRVYFPGDYLLDAHGNLSCLGNKNAACRLGGS